MSKQYTYNNERDFETWYKNNFGTEFSGDSFKRPEGMSDAVWSSVSPLLSNYVSSQSERQRIEDTKADYAKQREDILSRYSTAEDRLADEKRIAQQNASIAHDKLMKYLPLQLRAQGIATSGVSQTAYVDALNKYSNTMADISSGHSKGIADLEAEKSDKLSELDRYERTEIAPIEQSLTEAENTAFNTALEKYSNAEEERRNRANDISIIVDEIKHSKGEERLTKSGDALLLLAQSKPDMDEAEYEEHRKEIISSIGIVRNQIGSVVNKIDGSTSSLIEIGDTKIAITPSKKAGFDDRENEILDELAMGKIGTKAHEGATVQIGGQYYVKKSGEWYLATVMTLQEFEETMAKIH